jgi:peptide/nickel transport system substrate-binding protein
MLAAFYPLPALAKEEVTVKVHLMSDIRSIDPGVNRDGPTDGVMVNTVEGLVAYAEDASVKPMLAETIETTDGGKKYIFKLRQGVKFHNGQEMTAEDVVWSWQRYMQPATDWRCRSEFDGRGTIHVQNVVALDKYTVEYTLKEPNQLFLVALGRTDCAMTAVIQKDSVNADGTFKHPIGTGPFVITEWRKGEYVEMTKFADYVSRADKTPGLAGAKQALVDKVRFVVIPDASTAVAALRSGGIDIIPNIAGSELANIDKLGGIKVATKSSTGLITLNFQTTDKLLSNITLRKAISAAIDRRALVEMSTYGKGVVNASPIPVGTSYYSDFHKTIPPFEPQRVPELLKAAGYKGERIVMLTNRRFPHLYDATVLVQSMLQAAGINADIEVLEWGTQLSRHLSGQFQMQVFSYTGRFDPSLSYEILLGEKDKKRQKVWDTPEANKLLIETMNESDVERRGKLFEKLQAMFLEDVPALMLYNNLMNAAYRTKVRGYEPSITNVFRVWDVSIAN